MPLFFIYTFVNINPKSIYTWVFIWICINVMSFVFKFCDAGVMIFYYTVFVLIIVEGLSWIYRCFNLHHIGPWWVVVSLTRIPHFYNFTMNLTPQSFLLCKQIKSNHFLIYLSMEGKYMQLYMHAMNWYHICTL